MFHLLLLLLTASSALALDCAHRDYGSGSTVCVCNSTYCDNLGPIIKTGKGLATAYVSSKNGDRFTTSLLHFQNSASASSESSISVNIIPTRKYQKIIGFGGAFTDAAGINIAKLPKEMQTRLIRDYFASDGIEYTTGRIPIGGSDFSARPYTYHDAPGDDNLTKFALEFEDFNYKIPYLLMAQEVSEHKLRYFGSPWSAPKWLKTNNEINHGGFIMGKPGEKYYKIYAKYLIKFIQEYAKQNVNIWGITIENEPQTGYYPDFPWNSLGFDQNLERDFIKLDLGPELEANGYTKDVFSLMIYDDQLPLIRLFASGVLSDKGAAKYVSGIAFHWYINFMANWTDLDWLHERFPEHFLLASEACEEWRGQEKHVSLGNWAAFNRYAADIIQDLNHFTSGWTDWNLSLDLQGGPNWVGNFVDAPIIVNASSREYYKQPIFYAMGHFSKFLTPDSVRLHHDLSSEDPNIMITVFQRPDQGTVVIILNRNNQNVTVMVHDPMNGHLIVPVKEDSMETLIWY